jgi:hypothetical protein
MVSHWSSGKNRLTPGSRKGRAPGGVAANRIITKGLVSCRLPGGSGDRPFRSGEMPRTGLRRGVPRRGWLVLRNSGNGYGGASALWNNAAVTEIGSKSLTAYQSAGHPASGRVSGGYRR